MTQQFIPNTSKATDENDLDFAIAQLFRCCILYTAKNFLHHGLLDAEETKKTTLSRIIDMEFHCLVSGKLEKSQEISLQR